MCNAALADRHIGADELATIRASLAALCPQDGRP
jgi:hypothetical protein